MKLKFVFVLVFLLINRSLSAQIQFSRKNFKEERFSIFSPMDCVTSTNKTANALSQCYLLESEYSSTKLLMLTTYFIQKDNQQTESQFLKATMALENPSDIVLDFSKDIKTSLYGFTYSGFKVLNGNMASRCYFFFRKNDVVCIQFSYLNSKEYMLLKDIENAVNNFYWEGDVIKIDQIQLQVYLPYNLSAFWNEEQQKAEFRVHDAELFEETNANIIVNKSDFIPKMDFVASRKLTEQDLATIPNLTLIQKSYDIPFGDNLKADHYQMTFNEDGKMFNSQLYVVFRENYQYSFILNALTSSYNKVERSFKSFLMSAKFTD